MTATKMKHILVFFVILALMKSLEGQFASAKSVKNVVKEDSPSISMFLEEVLENKKANLEVEDRGCTGSGKGCSYIFHPDTYDCCSEWCIFYTCT